MRRGRRPGVLLTVVAVLALAASAGGGKSSPGAGTAKATEKDFAISLSPTTVDAGKVTFDVTNNGPSVHEFVVFKTDLAADQLPLSKDGSQVDENGSGVTHVDEIEDVKSGSTQTLQVQLQAGKYVVICNLPGHYKLGMHAPLTVS
jgi:uncharacterized cupredoxin-like copper-binding protein